MKNFGSYERSLFSRRICWKNLACIVVSLLFQNYLNFLPMPAYSNEGLRFVIRFCVLLMWGNYSFVTFPNFLEFFRRQFIWDILHFLQVPATLPLGCLSQHSHHAFFHVFSLFLRSFFQPSLCNAYFYLSRVFFWIRFICCWLDNCLLT